MRKLHKIFALSTLAIFIFTGCVNSIITDDPGSLDNRNIELRIINYWGNNFFSRDSVYNKNGANFVVDDVQLLFSNFFVGSQSDTVIDYSSFTLTTTKQLNHKIGLITEQSVSGGVGVLVGLDTIANATSPGNWSAGDVLANGSIYSGPNIGYNFVTVKGRAFNPSKPDETSPSLPFTWVVATNSLVSLKGVQISFSVPVGKQVVLDAYLNVEALFDDLSPVDIPNINSDPNDADDFANAVTLSDNFKNKAFAFD
jgi:hypothetical protein